MGIATQSLAVDGIFFNVSSSKKLAADIDFYNKTIINNNAVIVKLKDANVNLLDLSKEYKTKTEALILDKGVLLARGDNFEKIFNTCSKELNECIESRPSRAVWFGSGVIASLVIGVAALLIAK
jgi:hypothetical protein